MSAFIKGALITWLIVACVVAGAWGVYGLVTLFGPKAAVVLSVTLLGGLLGLLWRNEL